jgi:hypothetical protein
LALAPALIAATPPTPPESHSAALAGCYDGGQMEMAAGLELRADGRYRYGLSYGALGEESQGAWSADGGAVYLTSDRYTAPHFSFLEEKPSADGGFHVALDLPEGMERQYFDAAILMANGEVVQQQLGQEGLTLTLDPASRPARLRLLLGVFDLQSDAFPLSGSPRSEVHLRFEPNDVGKVTFDRTALRRDGEDLLLDRFDRPLRFRPAKGGC